LFLDSAAALFRLAFGLAIAALLTELFFFNFNKVPFTCSYLPAKSHLAFLGGAYLYGFTIYTFTMSSLELWIGESAMRIVMFFLFVAGILISVSVSRESPDIIYEDDADPVVRQLNIV
jgi:succinate-acetate transporter protein